LEGRGRHQPGNETAAGQVVATQEQKQGENQQNRCQNPIQQA